MEENKSRYYKEQSNHKQGVEGETEDTQNSRYTMKGMSGETIQSIIVFNTISPNKAFRLPTLVAKKGKH